MNFEFIYKASIVNFADVIIKYVTVKLKLINYLMTHYTTIIVLIDL